MRQNGNNSKLVHLLFYWNENNQYIFSRTKFLTFITFVVVYIASLPAKPTISVPTPILSIISAFLLSAPIFVIGFIIHSIMNIDSSFYEDDVLKDIKHFLFYWHDKSNTFVLSKTKIVTLIIIIPGLLAGLSYVIQGRTPIDAIVLNMITLVFAIPIFLIGYAIHKFLTKDNNSQSLSNDNIINNTNSQKSMNNIKINSNIDKSDISPKFNEYMAKIEELKKEFDERELTTKELIAAKFTPPQITYDRFIAVVDKCSTIFNEEYNAALNLISFTSDDSTKVDDEINSKIDIMQSFLGKLDDLSSELVINMSKTKNDDIEDTLSDMENLISSINNYED